VTATPPPAPRSAARGTAGSALVEALVALVLIALAGLVVATGAMAGLRAARRAATLARVTGVAERELAFAANAAAAVADETTTLAVAGFADPVTRTTAVERADALVRIAVTVAGGRPAERVTLATSVAVAP
jgi:hypothetical protein